MLCVERSRSFISWYFVFCSCWFTFIFSSFIVLFPHVSTHPQHWTKTKTLWVVLLRSKPIPLLWTNSDKVFGRYVRRCDPCGNAHYDCSHCSQKAVWAEQAKQVDKQVPLSSRSAALSYYIVIRRCLVVWGKARRSFFQTFLRGIAWSVSNGGNRRCCW